MIIMRGKTHYLLRDINYKIWIEFQVIAKREGISAAEKLRQMIEKEVSKHEKN